MFCSVYCMSLLNQCVLHFITGPSSNYHVLHIIIVFCMSLFKGAVARKRKLFKLELRNVVILEFNLWENIARNVYYTRLFYTARGVYTRSHYMYSKY